MVQSNGVKPGSESSLYSERSLEERVIMALCPFWAQGCIQGMAGSLHGRIRIFLEKIIFR
jgi:hypothetical protein